MAPIIKENWEIELMREAGRIAAGAVELMKEIVVPGITTRQVDTEVEKFIRSKGAVPTFKGYRGFTASICASINEEVVHGIPGDRVLKEGDIIGLDVGATYKNYVGDTAVTLPVGKISGQAQKLIDVTRDSLSAAIAVIAPQEKLSTISRTIQNYVESRGFSVVKKFVGHGIGSQMHEDPQVPNYVIEPVESFEMILKPGIVLAIEPMVNEGTDDVRTLKNGWTVVTRDGKLSAHFEHTVAVTDSGNCVLTVL
ncbi:MAG: type I methionyl aminopeptidase [Planctomycetes bacterium RBG_16_43_13]|nr:MAG: type I methionyl aminopeptidase [Planctomycetes bacterium RBG_16_43_13]